MQAKSAAARSRRELLDALNVAAREAAGLGAFFAKAVADRLGVNQTDFECMDIIALRGRVTAGDLARASGLTTGAVTGVIDRLEQAGIARRERDAGDRRKVYVSILPAALAAGAAHYDSFEKALKKLAGRYTDAEIALLVDYFTRSRDLILGEIDRLKREPPARAARARPRKTRAAKPPLASS
jgi:DNA-binding MarR family transcriptional regulator